jgi:hypothetical protein
MAMSHPSWADVMKSTLDPLCVWMEVRMATNHPLMERIAVIWIEVITSFCNLLL